MLFPGIVEKQVGYVNTKCRGAERKNKDGVIGLRIAPDQEEASSTLGEYE